MLEVNNQNVVSPDRLTEFQRKLVLSDHTEEQHGVVITPDPTGIVIKTMLLKEKQNHLPLDDCVDDSYLPRTLSSIYSASQNKVAVASETNDTKVFLNICTHPLIAVPGKRKGLDEGSGKEVDGWRLPMSMGELRLCYDKMGKSAIAADCVLNPTVVREMNIDPNYFHCVCDLIVECASKKFGRTWFDGHYLDRRFKLPKMKYAGYVDETTGLPARFDGAQPSTGSVAKQRVKGHGGKSPIIEELDCHPSKHSELSNKLPLSTTVSSGGILVREMGRCQIIELYISYNQNLTPLFDFLKLASELVGIVPQGQPSENLREIIKSPKLKNSNQDIRHDSQRLIAPIPLDTNFFLCEAGVFESNRIKTSDENRGLRFDQFSITAKCSANMTVTPTLELSAFALILSGEECVLPFPVDAHRSTVARNPHTGDMEIRMPILWCSGPDPGTRQWELQKAFSVDGRAVTGNTVLGGETHEIEYPFVDNPDDTFFGNFFRNADDESDDIDESKPLPEDGFHSQDILSRHILQQQEEERKARTSARKADNGGGAEVEYLNLNEILPNPGSAKDDDVSPTLKKAGNVLRNHLQGYSKDFVMGLV